MRDKPVIIRLHEPARPFEPTDLREPSLAESWKKFGVDIRRLVFTALKRLGAIILLALCVIGLFTPDSRD